MAKKTAAPAPAVTATPENLTAERRPGRSAEVISVESKPASEPSITSKLFPDMLPQEPKAVPENVEKELPTEEPKNEAVVSPEPTDPEEFYLEDILEKYKIPLDKLKSRIKVDEKEEVLPFSELKKRVQLKEHLDRAGLELGRKRREWAEERKRAGEGRPSNFPQNPAPAEPAFDPRATSENDSPEYARLLQRMNALEARSHALDPVIFDTNIQKVAKELKADGFDDFLDYIPKMETFIAKIEDPATQEYYDTDIGAKALYMRLKSQDLMAERKAPLKVQPGAPLQERPAPPIVKMDSGQQPSSLSTDDIDDKSAKYSLLLNRWKQTRDPNDFRELLKLQGALPK